MNKNTIEFNEFILDIKKIDKHQQTLLKHVFIAISENRTLDKSYYITSTVFIGMEFEKIIRLLHRNIKLSIIDNNKNEWYGSDIISDIRLLDEKIFFRPANILREVILKSKESPLHSYLKYVLFHGIRYKPSLLFMYYLQNLNNTPVFTLSIPEFKAILEFEEANYTNFNSFNSAVIDKILKDINQKTTYSLEIIPNTIPRRNKVISLTFTYYDKGLNNV